MKINKALYIIPSTLVTTTLLTGLVLSSTITKADGNTNVTDTLNITVNSACTMTGGPTGESTTDNTYTATIDPGTYSEISGSKLVTLCNDSEGYSIYAIGFSGDSYDTDNTKLLGQGTISGTNINTGTTGSNSYWAMKLEAVQGLTPPTIETGWNDYHVIPDTYTQIAEYANSTASPSDAGASVQTKYKVNISSSQTAGSYTGKVKYTMVHPNDADAPSTDQCEDRTTLYDLVACRSKGTQTAEDFEVAITKENSGVYEYDNSVFGAPSDASNNNKIYYYRGVLDDTVGTYGSDGDNEAYPNTVVLSSANNKTGLTNLDTCWRIVRTTGSGGIKMIYNGKWTGSSCANSENNTGVNNDEYNGNNVTYRQIVRAGYTYNSTYAVSTLTYVPIKDVMGSNQDYSVNDTDSAMKTYLEDSWFSTISAFENKLEASAGYCNDRTMNSTWGWTIPEDENNTVAIYGSQYLTEYYFGAHPRVYANLPSLSCPRNEVDLYTTNNATNGNKQLSKPVALLTADEAHFAGAGEPNGIQANENYFLRSGATFWLLSPFTRNSDGGVSMFEVFTSGDLYSTYVNNKNTIWTRPVISLESGVIPSSGSGTSNDPWIINP